MVPAVALSDVHDQGTVIRQEEARDMDSLRVPDLRVFYGVLLSVQHRQEAELSAYTEVSHDHVEALIQKCILASLF